MCSNSDASKNSQVKINDNKRRSKTENVCTYKAVKRYRFMPVNSPKNLGALHALLNLVGS